MQQYRSAVKVEQIEGLREFITQVLAEERDRLIPPTIVEDMERLRRSPAGAIIRLEEKVDHLDEQIGELRNAIARTATKEELAALAQRVATKEELAALAQRVATKEELAALAQRVATKEELAALAQRVATKEELARMATEERVVGLERVMDARFAEMDKRISLLQRVGLAMFSIIVTLQVAILVKLLLP